MAEQLSMNIYRGRRGGRRPNSGHPRIHSKGVAHRTREKVTKHTPLHINFKVRLHIRNKTCLKILKGAIQNARRQGLRVVHFSLQSNHVHLLIEAHDNETLTKGMRSLTITFAKRIQKGRIQKERYHLHVLKTPKETKNALKYVLLNEQKHTRSKLLRIDEFLSPVPYGLVRAYVKKEKLRMVWNQVPEPAFLDKEGSFLLRKAVEGMLV